MQGFLTSVKSACNKALEWAMQRKLLLGALSLGTWAALIENWFLFTLCAIIAPIAWFLPAIRQHNEEASKKAEERILKVRAEMRELDRREVERRQSMLEFEARLEREQRVWEADREAKRIADLRRKYPRRSHQRVTRKDRFKPLPPYMPTLTSDIPVRGTGRKVAGIFYHRSKISRLLGPIPEGHESNQRDTKAVLVIAPDNPYDENAIAVFVEGLHIGYFPSDRAQIWANTLDELEGQGFHLEVPIKIKQVSHDSGPRAAMRIPDHDLFMTSPQYQNLFNDEDIEEQDTTDTAE